MSNQKTALERAFELAASGTCASVSAIRLKLSEEGFATTQLTGPTLIKQLRERCVASYKPIIAEP